MSKHLILVGGGHAHLTTLKQLGHFISRGHRVTLVSPAPFHDYSGMGPALLSGRYRLSEVRFNVARMTTIRGGRFIEAAATGIDPDNRKLFLDDSRTLNYDVISFNSGSRVNLPIPKTAIGNSIYPVKPINNLYHARQKILTAAPGNKNRLQLLVIGGGPAGCEITGNLQALSCKEGVKADIIQVSGSRLLGSYPASISDRVHTLLAREELQLIEGTYVRKLQMHRALLDDNRTIDFDIAFVACGVTPNGPFNETGLADDSSGLVVNESLQSPRYPEIFGGGDCISFQSRQLSKIGVHAVGQSLILRNNLMASLESRQLEKFFPQRNYLLIFNLGLGRAIASGYGINWAGFSAHWLKSYLDHSFIKKYQEVG